MSSSSSESSTLRAASGRATRMSSSRVSSSEEMTASESTSTALASASESTPLLSSPSETPRYDGDEDEPESAEIAADASQRRPSSPKPTKDKSIRWPSVIAVTILSLLTATILISAFIVPAAIQEYAKEAAVVEPTHLSLESITADGIHARFRANARFDAHRVKNEHVRRIGRVVTWLARNVRSEETIVNVFLPEYENLLFGTTTVPPLSLDVVDGHNTPVDVVAKVVPGNADGIRALANKWLKGKLETVQLRGEFSVTLMTGIIPLGTHFVSESMTFEGTKLPNMPEYNITNLIFHEKSIPNRKNKVMAADVSVTSFNKYPVSLDVPVLGFDILLPGCDDTPILVAGATTCPIAVRPESDVVVEVEGIIEEIPKSLTQTCPRSDSSPLDNFFGAYIQGEPATVFVRGHQTSTEETPDWLAEILASVTVPVSFPGGGDGLDDLLRNFSLTDVHFSLPDPLAEPDDPDSNPKVSGTILALAVLPSEINMSLDVTNIHANANVFYNGRQLGTLEISEKANSTQIPGGKDKEPMIQIESRVHDAPLNVTDGEVLTDVIEALLFGGTEVILDINALVDVEVKTVLGQLTVKRVPAEGKIPVKPIPKNLFGSVKPQVGNIEIIDTTPDSITLQAMVNVTNPTPYSATVPYVSVHLFSNGSLVGEAWARDVEVKQGKNTDLVVSATWRPAMGGEEGRRKGRDMISRYLSGFNGTEMVVRTHGGSIPAKPELGEALSRLNMTIEAPKIRMPGDDGDGDGDDNGGGKPGDGGGDGDDDNDKSVHFIRDATFHVLSSTATFTLVSPLTRNTIYIDRVNATALYNHTEPIGRILYDLPFAAPPGVSQTPKLPVEWSLDSVGYEKLKEALGGRLKLDARATVGVRIGRWTEEVWYVGKGIGAFVRI